MSERNWWESHGGRIHFGDRKKACVLLIHGKGCCANAWLAPSRYRRDQGGGAGETLSQPFDVEHTPAPIKLRRDTPNVPGAPFKFGYSEILYGNDRDRWDREKNWFDFLVWRDLTVAAWSMDGDTFHEVYPSAREAFLRFLDVTAMRANGIPSPVAIVAHSRGGLIARQLLKELGNRGRVHWLITLGTPHRGSQLASVTGSLVPDNLPLMDDVRDMLTSGIDGLLREQLGSPGDNELAPDSHLLRSLANGERPLPNVLYTTVAGTSPKLAKAYAWLFDAMSAVPQFGKRGMYFEWTANPVQLMAILNDVPLPLEEVTTGNGDGLVAADRAHLPWSERMTFHINHAQMLWTDDIKRAVGEKFMSHPRPLWIGDFDGDRKDEILCFEGKQAHLRKFDAPEGEWRALPNSEQLADLWDGRPCWRGHFTRTDREQILIFDAPPFDGNWWLGTVLNDGINWRLAARSDFGAVCDGRPFFCGRFSLSPKDEILFPQGDGWKLGAFTGAQLQWRELRNAGDPSIGPQADRYATFIGRFNSINVQNVLLYRQGTNGNFWIGHVESDEVRWTLVDATSGVVPDLTDLEGSHARLFTGPYTQELTTEILLFTPSDRTWWLGQFSDEHLNWTPVGNAIVDWPDDPVLQCLEDGRPIWSGCFVPGKRAVSVPLSHFGKSGGKWVKKPVAQTYGLQLRESAVHSLLFYLPHNQTWWLGTLADEKLMWKQVGESSGFGQIWDGRPFWIAKAGDGLTSSIVFYTPYNGDWFIGTIVDGKLAWDRAANTEGHLAGAPNYGDVWT